MQEVILLALICVTIVVKTNLATFSGHWGSLGVFGGLWGSWGSWGSLGIFGDFGGFGGSLGIFGDLFILDLIKKRLFSFPMQDETFLFSCMM